MDWMNLTVAGFCELSNELCVMYACSVTTTDLYLQ